MKSTMTKLQFVLLVLLAGLLGRATTPADDRRFTYSYEPETLPQGATELEQWITVRTQRNKAVGQDNFNRWELRTAVEYGVTDNYALEFYLNFNSESYRDPATATDFSKFTFDGVSIE